ncbi:pentatricopeptide repeat-containing protein At1g73400, mitochondrial isoform X1 [Primulina eburnea]|uniref:pentatricopeptide repeat-containing protein At1g73400, mitochondrial isoform X1 n=2 Tax=Primulina eburnea TaxID=1245227 RepID=UPI003C6CBE40
MFRQLSVSRALCTTQRFLSILCSLPIACHLNPPPRTASFSCFSKNAISGRPFSALDQTVFISQYFLQAMYLSNAVKYPSFSSSLVLVQILRKFCTLEGVVFKEISKIGSVDCADEVYKTVLDYSNPEYKMEEALDKLEVKLTTPLVVEVLHRIHFEEKLALRFFNWAAHQEHYNHESEAYTKMIDILSSTKYKVKQFRIICDLLYYMKQSKKTSVPIEELFTILRRYAEKHLTHLRKFAQKKKIRVKTQPEINAFNLLLDSLCKCSLVEDAEVMFKRVKIKIQPNADTYNILFFGWCRVMNPTRGINVLQEMINKGHSPESFTYNTAINTFCKAGMVTEAAKLLEFMKSKGSSISSPTAKSYVIMMIALAENDRMEECFKMLNDMKKSGYLPDVSTYKELIEGMCSAGKIEAAYKFLEEMGRAGYPSDIVTYNCFLKVLCDNKNRDEAFTLFTKMIEAGCIPSVQTYNMLIAMFFRIGDPDGAFEAWDDMDERGCSRDSNTYCVMIEGLFGCSNAKDASFLLKQVINMGMKLPYVKFDAFLTQLSKVGDLGSIHRLSEHMRKFYNPAIARRVALNQKRKSMSLRGN